MPDFSIGVDLGGTNLRVAAFTSEGQLLEKVSLGTKVSLGPDHVVNEMCDSIRGLAHKYSHKGAFQGAGIGVLGIIDLETGMMRKSANFPGWTEYPARAEIERRLGFPVILENDGNVAALGEKWMGAGRFVPNMAMVTLGTGIGGGIVLDGKIWHGLHGMAGEFGHMTVEPEGVPCGCGSHGCAERYASATALVRMAQEAAAHGDAPGLVKALASDPEFGSKAIYNLAMQGDEGAQRLMRRFGQYLGIMMGDIINALNLDMYVIGGGVSSAWDAFAPAMFQEMRERSLVYAATAPADPLGDEKRGLGRAGNPERKTIVTRALLGSDAGLYGAARMPIMSA